MNPFPTVDVSRTDSATAREVDRICRETGFLAAVGHGVPQDLVQDVFRAAGVFFDLPLEDKMRVAMPFPGYPYGYSPFAKETLAASRGEETPPDLKESFSIGPESTWDAKGWDPSQGFTLRPDPLARGAARAGAPFPPLLLRDGRSRLAHPVSLRSRSRASS